MQGVPAAVFSSGILPDQGLNIFAFKFQGKSLVESSLK